MNRHDMDLSGIWLFKMKLRKKEIAFICRQIAYILNSGLNINYGFDVLIESAPNSKIKKRFTLMKSDLLNGLSISSCFRKAGVFPNFLVSMINVGERTDRLGVIMKNMADFYDNDARLAGEITNAMLYPAFVSVSMIVIVIAALVLVVPNYAFMFTDAGEALPLPTRLLIAMSNFFIKNGYLIIISLPVFVFAVLMLLNTEKGKYAWGKLKLKIIIAGKYNTKSINLYFAKSMSLLLSSKSDIISALLSAKDILGNAACSRQIDVMIDKIRQGSPFSRAIFDSDIFERMMYSMVKLGEETDRLPSTLDECAKYLEEELQIAASKMKELILPASTIILGLILAFIVIATMLPTVQVTSFF